MASWMLCEPHYTVPEKTFKFNDIWWRWSWPMAIEYTIRACRLTQPVNFRKLGKEMQIIRKNGDFSVLRFGYVIQIKKLFYCELWTQVAAIILNSSKLWDDATHTICLRVQCAVCTCECAAKRFISNSQINKSTQASIYAFPYVSVLSPFSLAISSIAWSQAH